MADPIPGDLDAELQRARAAMASLKRVKPQTAAEARARSCELVRLHKILSAAARKVTDANAAKRISSGGNGAKPASGKSFTEGQVRAIVKIIATCVRSHFDAYDKRLAELEANSLQYEGTWREGKTYSRGTFATHQGSLWFCEDANVGVRPGSESTAWKLAVKRGRAEK